MRKHELKSLVLKKVIMVVIIFLVVALGAIFLLPGEKPVGPGDTAKPQVNEPLVEKAPRKIDGVLVPKDDSDQRLFAIMIENHPDARPQSGLSQARLVVEAPVEGGITRFMAVYDGTEDIAEIGPVRSARPYYLDWAKELDAAYGHVGGSPEALKTIPKVKVLSFNQFFNDKYYRRVSRKKAPHNVYTSSVLLQKFAADRKLVASKLDSWLYQDGTSLAGDSVEASSVSGSSAAGVSQASAQTPVADLVIQYSTDQFEVTWKYDAKTDEYVRYVSGAAHADMDGKLIRAKNVAVQYAKMVILDKEGRRQVSTIDSGRAVVFSGGQVTEGTWQKKDRTSRTRFYDANGGEVKLVPGTTWIQVVPKGADVQY